ncbi:PrsW family intramembrane metalloprotease [Kitasatospora purpeofusca]|uniref:PrsW family intramembrane metalloprotease n=1 Tax=Kitasatospora purpeofusca TaxID=67352 RepID=UPI002A59F664|nr:PrsW family intramembrane metalloprotease [Kitasatospora purpeofusca]MDY0814449.1 PrsW family intramembrane metalloprotease [Kitasatospora purpeofusca]
MSTPSGDGYHLTVRAADDRETPTPTADTRTIPGPRGRRAQRLVPRPGRTDPQDPGTRPDGPTAPGPAPGSRRPLRPAAFSAVTATAVLALAGCGVLILQLVRRQTGTAGLLVGLGLATVPLPFVLGGLAWLNRTARVPLRHTVFCLGWGACAATTVAILANGWTSTYLSAHQGSLGEALAADLITPVIEESAKGAALLVLLLPIGRRPRCAAGPGGRPRADVPHRLPGPRQPRGYERRLTGPHARGRLRLRPYPRPLPHPPAAPAAPALVAGGRPSPTGHRRARSRPRTLAAGVVLGGITACGFAFTENALYLGRAFTDDQQQRLDSIGLGESPSLRDFDSTVQTFVLRGLLSPFAHPLFTALTGLGLAVTLTTGRRLLARLAAPTGLVLAMTLHGTWNAAADLGTHGFLLVYAVLMVPCFAALVCFSAWARSRAARHPGRAGPPAPRARAGVRTAARLGRRFAARLEGWLGGPAGGP